MTRKILFIIASCTIFLTPVKAQELSGVQIDSLYNLFVQIRTHTHQGIQSADTMHIKCAFGIVSEIKFNFNRFDAQQKAMLKPLLDRPVTDTSFVTPNGFFRVHYDLTGTDVPTYSLDSLAIALDSAYNFEVNYLGYPPPPSDNGAGGDNRYDIYIQNLGNTYGYTEPETEVSPGSGRYTSYLVINYNFSSFYTKGINAARVTVAHEFHHAIQIGDYIYRYDLDEFFYELTSTSMEHFVYPSIHDYYQYLPSYFQNTQYSLGKNGGLQEYALAIWNIFLQQNFGYDIIKKQWELMPKERALQAISDSFSDYNTSFGEQFNKFGLWTFFSGYRSEYYPQKHFANASDYPVLQPIITLDINSTGTPVQTSTSPVTNNFIQFVNPQNQDTLVALLSNDDIEACIANPDTSIPFQYNLYTFPQTGANKLSNAYFYSFQTGKPSFWISSAILNNQVLQSGQYIVQNNDFAFPTPFYYKKNSFIYIPVLPDKFGYADVNVYSSSMRLVYSTHQAVSYIYGQKVIRWNGLNNKNQQLASGVYIYVTKSGNNVTKGKLVIFQ